MLTGLADPESALIAFWLSAILLVPVARRSRARPLRRSVSYVQNTVIVGAGDVGQLIARKLIQHPEYGIDLLGFVDDAPEGAPRRPREPDAPRARRDSLRDMIRALDVERVIVAFSNDAHADTLRAGRTRCATSTSRSTSCRGCSSSSARASTSTPSRACR